MTFDVIGDLAVNSAQVLPDNIEFHGVLPRSSYQTLMSRADVAIGTLGMHRKDMEEASPLKVREYLAYGIPTIIGYRDTDFPGEYPWLLRLANTPDNVAAGLGEIRDFVARMKGVRVPREAVEHLDVRRKERARLDFMESTLMSGSK